MHAEAVFVRVADAVSNADEQFFDGFGVDGAGSAEKRGNRGNKWAQEASESQRSRTWR